MQILLGPAGSPANSTLEGVSAVKKLGLDVMEVQFTHGVRMKPELAEKIGEAAKSEDIKLSVHAPYYINLTSVKNEVVKASKERIIQSCYIGHILGATNIVFHPGYYLDSKEKTYRAMKTEISEIQSLIKKNKWNVKLSPEIGGKLKQFGDLEDTLKISKDLGCSFCIDVGHLYARNQGKINYKELFDALENYQHVHFHFTGMEYTAAGERRHLTIDNEPSFKDFAKELLRREIDATIISESPVTWEDSLKMKKILEGMGHKF